jgi:hypothetical protein
MTSFEGCDFCDIMLCGSSKNRRFKGTYRLHLQGNENLEFSQLATRICLKTDGEESPLHGTSTAQFMRYHKLRLMGRCFVDCVVD